MKELIVSDIQHFSTGDGPGIRSTVFLKGCNLHCPWCHNPETAITKTQTLVFRGGVTKSYGAVMTAGEIARDVCGDMEFYRESGGGVTVSGGEPMLQAEGVAELAKILAQKGVDTLIDTAGCVPYANFETVRPFVSAYYYDVKTADEEKFAELTGGDLETVTDNLRRLVLTGADVRARIPFIPGVNTDDEDCGRIAELIARCGCRRASLLPFHRLGAAKYEALGIEYKFKSMPPPDKALLEHAAEIYGKYVDIDIE